MDRLARSRQYRLVTEPSEHPVNGPLSLLIDAWCMVMPKTIAASWLKSQGIR